MGKRFGKNELCVPIIIGSMPIVSETPFSNSERYDQVFRRDSKVSVYSYEDDPNNLVALNCRQ